MSENRFSKCETPRDVMIASYKAMCDSFAGGFTAIADDAIARIAELTPRTVDEAGRERARKAARDWWEECCTPTFRISALTNADEITDRIIDALGWTAAEPDPAVHGIGCGCLSCLERVGIKLSEPAPAPATPPSIVTEEQRERFNRVWGELYTVSPPLYSEFHQLIAALGATPAESPTAPTGDGRAVELDVTALERIRAVLNCHENTRAAMDKLPMFGAMPDITIPGALPMRITTNPFGVSVLRIGGTDE